VAGAKGTAWRAVPAHADSPSLAETAAAGAQRRVEDVSRPPYHACTPVVSTVTAAVMSDGAVECRECVDMTPDRAKSIKCCILLHPGSSYISCVVLLRWPSGTEWMLWLLIAKSVNLRATPVWRLYKGMAMDSVE